MNRDFLTKLLDIEGIPSSWYSLYGDFFVPDRIVLHENYSKWEIFYIDERGNKTMLTTCNSEATACAYIHQKMINGLPREKQIYFSQPPKLLPQTLELLHKKEIIEILIRIWIDSIIYDGRIPENVNALIFELDNYIDKCIIRFWGASNNNTTGEITNLPISYIPFHDNISIGIEKIGYNFDKEFSNIISRLRQCQENIAYKDFFKGKSIYVGFKGNMHIVS